MAELHLKRRATGYIKALQPLIAELLRSFKLRLFFVVLSSLLAVVCELGGLALLYLLFKPGSEAFLEKHGASHLPGEILFSVPVILLCCAAVLYIVSGFQALRLAGLFGEHSLQRLHAGLRKMTAWPATEVTRDFSTARKLVRVQRDALMVNTRVIRLVNSIWTPVLFFLGAYVLLFFIDYILGLVVTAVLGVLLLAQAVISFKSARSNSNWEKTGQKVFALIREDLASLLAGSAGVLPEDKHGRAVRNLIGASQNRVVATLYSQAATSIGMIFAVVLVIIYMQSGGGSLLQEGLSSTLAILAIMIRMFMSLRVLAKRITVINRFYLQLSRYFRLLRILECGGDPSGGGQQAFKSTTIVTDLPDNRLNRLRWRFLLFGGQSVDFDGSAAGPRVSIVKGSALDKVSEQYVWIDFNKMKNEPPVLCRADEVATVMDRFFIDAEQEAPIDAAEEDDDFE